MFKCVLACERERERRPETQRDHEFREGQTDRQTIMQTYIKKGLYKLLDRRMNKQKYRFFFPFNEAAFGISDPDNVILPCVKAILKMSWEASFRVANWRLIFLK